MPSVAVAGGDLTERSATFDEAILPRAQRAEALERFHALRSGRERPGRFWRIDLDAIVPEAGSVDARAGSVVLTGAPERVVACDLQTAAREHPDLLARAFGVTAARTSKFGSLTAAFAQLGAFIYVPADLAGDEPIAVAYEVPAGASLFPYTVVLAERGARATIVERVTGGAGALICGVTEIVTGEYAEIAYAALQAVAGDGRVLQTRTARPGRNARIAWSVADLGGALAASDLSVEIEQPGVEARLTALFFPNASQHVDMVSTMWHAVGQAASETLVKSAAIDRGQGRYLGNIRIAPHAQGTDASLRDDALLLSPKAHIDSIPALEIAANDVKAFHGATVGALDDDQIFYMESRGIEPAEAERMIALGFFEPAIERFPTHALREELRAALQAKLP